jgi:hypothetical protein
VQDNTSDRGNLSRFLEKIEKRGRKKGQRKIKQQTFRLGPAMRQILLM